MQWPSFVKSIVDSPVKYITVLLQLVKKVKFLKNLLEVLKSLARIIFGLEPVISKLSVEVKEGGAD